MEDKLFRVFMRLTAGLAFLCISFVNSAQELKLLERRNSYIPVNSAQPHQVFTVYDGLLAIHYVDEYAFAKTITAKVLNWKMEEVLSYQLAKLQGANCYVIDLKEDLIFSKDDLFYLVMTNEDGQRYRVCFRTESLPPSDLQVEIYTNPLNVNCESTLGNVAEFYGLISNGRAPFKINWYVINAEKTALLYQPKSESVTDTNETSTVQVDVAPAYYVLLDVTDACGNNVRKMLLIQCTDAGSTVNSLFVQPVNNFIIPNPGN